MKRRPTLSRICLSMPGELLDQLDGMVKEKGYASRSQAVAQIVRVQLVEHRAQKDNGELAGNVMLVYDHHKRNIQASLTRIQHGQGDIIIAMMHVHLDDQNCMEVLALRGPAGAVRRLADRLIAVKGVKHGRLTVTTTKAKPGR